MRLQTKLIGMGGRLLGDRRGNVAMILALCALPLALMVGFSVDLVRQQTTKQDAQSSVDHAALAAAISRAKTRDELQGIVEEYLAANLDTRYLGDDYDVVVDYNDQKQIIVSLQGRIDAFFAALIGQETLPINVNVTAVRGAADAVELVLVLDNTGSMEKIDGGVSRMSALKSAATELVEAVKENEDADVKIGVVPYGEYVNVGESNRGAPWLLANEKDVKHPEGEGTYPAKTCARYETRTIDYKYNGDGFSETRSRTETYCAEQKDHPQAGQKYKTGGGTTYYRFRGCVYSRVGAARLTDADALTNRYPGMIETDANPDCMTPILPLTATKSSVTTALAAMRTRVNGREPQTYIPTGLLWGINVLSPATPFTEGKAYGSGNRNPRKIMVLMTDGENTMRHREDGAKTYGYHEATAAPGQIKQTNDDVTALCTYAKSNGIELYTVALGVGGDAQAMLQGCATQPEFFFNAASNAALGDAFRDIAASINKVRLIR